MDSLFVKGERFRGMKFLACGDALAALPVDDDRCFANDQAVAIFSDRIPSPYIMGQEWKRPGSILGILIY